ncbi:hypothetical protein TNCV_2892801 [Trichonephila clavipes]|nr:hypothetical protein TNCV_2892801 [Trichonephila clavipes]
MLEEGEVISVESSYVLKRRIMLLSTLMKKVNHDIVYADLSKVRVFQSPENNCSNHRQDSQLASLDKNNALREIKLRLSYLQGKSTTMSVIAHQTEKEWISANEKSRQRMSQTQAEGAAKQHAARLEEAHLRAHHLCFTTSERC